MTIKAICVRLQQAFVWLPQQEVRGDNQGSTRGALLSPYSQSKQVDSRTGIVFLQEKLRPISQAPEN